jgi:hypothetical protein
MKALMKTIAFLSVLSVIIFYSCQKEANFNTSTGTNDINKPHRTAIYLTDHQTPVFDSVFIDLRALEVKLEDDTLPNGGWVNMQINAGVYNILRFRNGLDTLFATGTLPNARINKIRLTLGTQNSVMKNGQRFPLRVKDEDMQVVLNLDDSNFEFNAPDSVRFWIDFDASRSIQVDNSGSGNNNGYRLKCNIKVFATSHSGRIEGRVAPRAADPVIIAFNATDTATAIPESDGEFKIVGLNPGTYSVLYDGNNGYLDTTIMNVVVRRGEDTHLPLITLRQ